ncbi:MAG: DUF4118 domain-containing protein, partial [Acidobacteriota bacterium]|nr:DUF4118 domain-containing protein [Acidobacteriota bacterium]
MSYALSMLGMAAMVALLLALRGRLNQSTIALALLLIILFTATWRGSRPALVNAVFGAVCFNFFFLPPYGTLTIADPQNWAALSAFAITAVTAGWLSAYAKRRAEEAESRQAEIERLYEELQASFQLASRAEALRQSERLKSALLDAVTHDIRTPLTSIKASVTTLLDEQEGSTYEGLPLTLDAETRREMLEVINEESDRLNRFVEGLIELARIEAGEMQLRRHWSSVEEIITTALARAAPLTRQHQIHIDSEKDLPVIRVDSRAVSEVIYTLIDNAAKYAPGGTLIRISAQRADDVTLLFAVEDEGPGIPPPLRERVFDKFFRAISDGDTGGQRPAGTGMGLAIAKGIVEA